MNYVWKGVKKMKEICWKITVVEHCIFKDVDLRNPKDVRRFYRLLALLDMEKTNRAGE